MKMIKNSFLLIKENDSKDVEEMIEMLKKDKKEMIKEDNNKC